MVSNYIFKKSGEIKQKSSQMEFFVEKHDLQLFTPTLFKK